ncbi:unnamed protein product [Penicillium salamii]|nr:unnamed protein product [Penicillium salamii]CAG8145203.1 unnamed protein product [Penicillium salamii]
MDPSRSILTGEASGSKSPRANLEASNNHEFPTFSPPGGPDHDELSMFLEFPTIPRDAGVDSERVWPDEDEDACYELGTSVWNPQEEQPWVEEEVDAGMKKEVDAGRDEFTAHHIEGSNEMEHANEYFYSNLEHLDSFLQGEPHYKDPASFDFLTSRTLWATPEPFSIWNHRVTQRVPMERRDFIQRSLEASMPPEPRYEPLTGIESVASPSFAAFHEDEDMIDPGIFNIPELPIPYEASHSPAVISSIPNQPYSDCDGKESKSSRFQPRLPTQAPPHLGQSKLTDSGYGSSAPTRSLATNDKNQVQNEYVRRTPLIAHWPEEHEAEMRSTADTQAAGAALESISQADEEGSIYSTTSSVTDSRKIAYVKATAKAISIELKLHDANEEVIDQVFQVMPALLKNLSLSIGENAKSQMHLDLMYFLRKNRTTISDSCRDILSSAQTSWKDRDESEAMSLAEKMKRWKGNYDLRKLSMMEQEGDDLSDAQSDADVLYEELPGLEDYQGILYSNPAYRKFVTELNKKCETQSTGVNILGEISYSISQMFPKSRRVSRRAAPQRYYVTFDMEWDPIAFLQEQCYSESPEKALADAIVLTGSISVAQASTCARYLQQTWPSSGMKILQLIQDLVKQGHSSSSLVSLPDRTEIQAQLTSQHRETGTYSVNVFVNGLSSWIIEVGVILSWMGSALRASPAEDRPATCRPSLLPQASSGPQSHSKLACKIQFSTKANVSPLTSNGSCWINLFRNPVVVKGYPIKRRSILHPGLEMPLGLMACLIGTSRVQPFADRLFIKGFSTMLMSIKHESNVMLWHLISSQDGRVSYNDGMRLSNSKVNLEGLQHSRHILGWCSATMSMAGDPDVKYHEIESSNLPKASTGCLLANASILMGREISGGETSFAVGKKDSRARGMGGHYIQKLKWIGKKSVLLWDEEDKRGWLVNGASALLHLVLTSLELGSKHAFSATTSFNRSDLEYPHRHHPSSASWTLASRSNRRVIIYDDDDQPMRFDEYVTQLYEALEKAFDWQSASPVSNKQRSRLEGWELENLANWRDPIFAKEAKLDAAGLSWVDLVRSIQAVTLFGCGFGDIIKSRTFCAQCYEITSGYQAPFGDQVPVGESYLTVCHEDLKEIATSWCGNLNSNPARLTDQIVWHIPDWISKTCDCTAQKQVPHSDIVQSLLPSNLARQLPTMEPSEKQSSGGAFIFGQNKSNLWHWPETGDPLKRPIRPTAWKVDHISKSSSHDSGIGDSLPSSELISTQKTDLSSGESQSKQPMPSLRIKEMSNHSYTVGIICALEIELKAVRMLFDVIHKSQASPTDTNGYVFGCMADHNIIASCLPAGEVGNSSATDVASNMKRTFLSLRFCLLVGIGGGAPSSKNDIRLGDVVVSKPVGENVGVLQYDMVKTLENGEICLNGHLQPSPRFLRSVSSLMQSDPSMSDYSLRPYLQHISNQNAEYSYPGKIHDQLFKPEHLHQADQPTCDSCDTSELQERPRRSTSQPHIHYGLIASGNQVMRSAETRDNLAKKYNVLCFEMEAAGIVNILPSMIIRGICDYSDSHKNKEWQNYAAATAAAYAKLLLSHVGTETEPAYRYHLPGSPDRTQESNKRRMREDSHESSDCEMHIAKRRRS